MFTEQMAWQIADEVAGALRVRPVADDLVSVYLTGGLPRNDFTPERSEVDLFFILESHCHDWSAVKVFEQLAFIKEVDRSWGGGVRRPRPCVDVGPWVAIDLVPRKDNASKQDVIRLLRRSGMKYLTIYAFDFVACARPIFGRDIREALLVIDPRELVPDRLRSLFETLTRYAHDISPEWADKEAVEGHITKCSTFEVARALFLLYGDRTLKKQPLFERFEKCVPEFQGKGFFRDLFAEYLDASFLGRLTTAERVHFFSECLRFAEGAVNLVCPGNAQS
ncbi:MAG TPA: hypothetical protein HPP83_06360 [Candidatus Hydrogenedentes bacterium]|nr:hypothetical protein [Candidatus Hydrogenedentota bacterium]